MTNRPTTLAVVLAAAALLSAGCGSQDAAGPASPTSATRGKAVRFATCMREQGVAAFPDPDASGQLTIDGVLNGSSIDPDGPAFTAALTACKALQPAGFTGQGERKPEQQSVALRFAACVRAHGVADFPDPAAGDALIDTNRIPSTEQVGGMARLDAATAACRDVSAPLVGATP